jgi:phage terminase large subunit GpA-like protein
MQVHIEQFQHLVRQSVCQINGEKPSQWIEKNVFIPKEPFPGQLSFKRSPYTREIVDRLSPDDHTRYIGVKKGAQIGFSTTVIYAGMMWLIKNNPGNSVLTVGSPDLIKGAMNRIDGYIDNSGIRELIGSQSRRVKNQKTGDTNEVKEFPNGFIKIFNAANHNNIRQDDYKYGFFDDFEAVKARMVIRWTC